MKKKQNKIIVADTDTGELHELTPIKPNKPIYIDKKQKFIKFYYNLIHILPTLTKSELTIIKHIAINLKPNKKKVVLTPSLTELPNTTFTTAIKNLKTKHIIKSTQVPQIFEINEEFMFNGTYYCDDNKSALNRLKSGLV